MSEGEYVVHLSEPHSLTDGDGTTLRVADYDDFGNTYDLELLEGSSRSVGRRLVERSPPRSEPTGGAVRGRERHVPTDSSPLRS